MLITATPMEFRTTIRISDNQGLLHHSDKVMLLGSCFSDNMGAKLRSAMMTVSVNPLGTLFNPISIADSVDRLAQRRPVAGAELFQQSGLWNCFAFHSRHSQSDKQATLDHMNRCVEQGHKFLSECQVLAVTLGTAMVYIHKDSGKVVANCHKVPQHQFERRLATQDEITQALERIVTQAQAVNPGLRLLFTVSPVRHIADGLDVNALSKAMLRVAVNDVVETHPDCATYFPAYEILLDDLRDYRFYATDMVHPSDVAIEYIWQTFQASYFDDRSAQAIARCERVSKRLTHRPMSNSREAVERFQADTKAVLKNLLKEYPYLESNPDVRNRLD